MKLLTGVMGNMIEVHDTKTGVTTYVYPSVARNMFAKGEVYSIEEDGYIFLNSAMLTERANNLIQQSMLQCKLAGLGERILYRFMVRHNSGYVEDITFNINSSWGYILRCNVGLISSGMISGYEYSKLADNPKLCIITATSGVCFTPVTLLKVAKQGLGVWMRKLPADAFIAFLIQIGAIMHSEENLRVFDDKGEIFNMPKVNVNTRGIFDAKGFMLRQS